MTELLPELAFIEGIQRNIENVPEVVGYLRKEGYLNSEIINLLGRTNE